MLRQAAEFSRQQRVRLPLVTLEPTEDGVYRIMEEPSDEPALAEPDDDTVGVPDDNRQVVFLDSRKLFRAN